MLQHVMEWINVTPSNASVATRGKLRLLELDDDGYVTVDVRHAKKLVVSHSSPFMWLSLL